jgi:hypothetical protein
MTYFGLVFWPEWPLILLAYLGTLLLLAFLLSPLMWLPDLTRPVRGVVQLVFRLGSRKGNTSRHGGAE